MEPQFLAYDRWRIPLPPESVDRVVCFDSFHHVPSQDAILAEIFRVLRRDGRVAMAGPGVALQLDLVDVGIAWFSQRESPTSEVELDVE